jgi:Ca2+-binding EF-hand superfamily protein
LAEFSKLVTTQDVNVNGAVFINQMDANHDGKVTMIENRAATLVNFDRLDTDKDGVVSPAEMRAGGLK